MMSNTPLYDLKEFDRLRAEREVDWLHQVFVAPSVFPKMIGERPVVLFGESGSGKTALRLELEYRVSGPGQIPTHLVVNWTPSLDYSANSGGEIVDRMMVQMFDRCAQAILLFLGRHPEMFISAKRWVKRTLKSFVMQYLVEEYEFVIDRLENDCVEEGIVLLQNDLPALEDTPSFQGQPTPAVVIERLSPAIQDLGLQSTWILVDGMETWMDIQQDVLERTFKALFSTLTIFEDAGFVFKLMLPATLEKMIGLASIFTTYRAEKLRLEWSEKGEPKRLVQVIEKRMSSALRKEKFTMQELVEKPDILINWLNRFGGGVPRGWLDLIKPVCAAFFQQPKLDREALSEDVLRIILEENIPKLHVDISRNRVFIGHAEIRPIEPRALKVLEYLYLHRDRVVPRAELFYKGYLGRDFIPIPNEDDYLPPKTWRGTLDTALWSLRDTLSQGNKNEIESNQSGEEKQKSRKESGDDDSPYLKTYRNMGVRLENTL